MIVLARVDERLIHGQVAVKWTGEVNAKQIVVADDKTAADPTMKNILMSIAPGETKVWVCSVTEATGLLKTPEFAGPDTRVMVLAKTPKPFLQMLNAGVDIKRLNVGNMGKSAVRKKYLTYFYATDEEIADLTAMMSRGVDVFCQDICDRDKGKSLSKVVK